MKHLLIFTLLWTSFTLLGQDKGNLNVLVFSGNYQGNNVIVHNPFDPCGVGFSIKRIEINGLLVPQNVYSSAFEIDLTGQTGLQLSDSVDITFWYADGAPPKLVGGSGFTPILNEEFLTLEISSKGLLTFCTQMKTSEQALYVEQYRWNKWIRVGELLAGIEGEDNIDCYQFQTHLVYGDNMFRVTTACDHYNYCADGYGNISPVVKILSEKSPVNILKSKEDEIVLNEPSMYEVFDTYGVLVKKGIAKEGFFDDLPTGLYYLNYDITTGVVYTKK